MRTLLKILFVSIFYLLSSQVIQAQSQPDGLPITKSNGWIEYGYLQNDSGRIDAKRDTNWTPRFAGTTVYWENPGVDTLFWYYNGSSWGTVRALIPATSITNAMLAGSIVSSKLVGTDIATVGTITTGTWNGTPIPDNKSVPYQLLGSTIVAECLYGGINELQVNGALVDQTVHYIALYIPKTQTITGVKWWQGVQGSYTANNYNGVGLYSYSGGTLTLVASSTDDGNIWKATANTMNSKAFSSTYAASPGIYFVAFLYCRSAEVTAPTIGGFFNGITNNNNGDFTNSAKLQGTANSQTSLLASKAMSAVTVTALNRYAALY